MNREGCPGAGGAGTGEANPRAGERSSPSGPVATPVWIRINIWLGLFLHMTDGTQKDFIIGVIAGWIIMVIIDLLVPFAGPIIGGFTTGYIAKGDVVNRAKAGVYAGLLAAIVITIALYQKLVHTPGSGYLAGWGTGLLLYLLVGLYFVCLAFLGAILTTAVRK
jgi:hypothetical protein